MASSPPFIGAGGQTCAIRMTAITKHHWTIVLRCSIMLPVSSIFLQENRFSPLPQRAFFLPARFAPARPGHFSLG
jgi:hypothetical protein